MYSLQSIVRNPILLRGRSHGRPASTGQALVELALILPVMLILLLAAIDLGRIYYAQITVANAARAGAYDASTNTAHTFVAGSPCVTLTPQTNSLMCAVQHESSGSAVNIAPADVAVTCTPSCAQAYGNKVGVTVTGHFTVLTPLMWVFTGGSNVTFSSTAVADVINVPGPVGGVAPVASFTATPITGTVPPPLSVTVTNTTTGSATAWSWNFGDGTTSTLQSPPAHSYASAGTYTITMSASNAFGSSTATPTTVTANAVSVVAPVAAFTATPMSGNAPLVVSITDNSSGNPTSWAWTFGDGQTSILQNPPAHTYASAGTYQLTLIATNSAGSSSPLVKTITVGSACPLPVANFTYSQQNKNKPVDFTSTSTPTSPPACAISYWRWQYGDALNSTNAGNFPTSSFDYNLENKTFQVTLTVTNPGGTVSITKSVTTQ